MKIKTDKKAAKRVLVANGGENKGKVEKPAKKAKLLNGVAPSSNTTENGEKSLKTVDTSIFQHFKELTNEEEKKRMEAALLLLQQLSKTKDSEKREKELSYTLKRLIRGCGASTNASRAGFFTGLVAFLKAFNEVSIEQIFDSMHKELHVGATIANKEDADAVVGKILICGALLHAGRIVNVNVEHLEQITNILLQSTRHRTYHSSLGFSFVIELLEVLTQKQFESSVWPLLHKELVKPWPKQTLQSVHCLIAAQKKFPEIINAKFLKSHFGGPELLNADSFQYLHKIFWEHSNTNILTHPAFELFGAYIAGNTKLTEFWQESVDPGLKTPTKLLEIETLKIATDILNNLNVTKTNVVDLLSDNFMKIIIEGLRNLKQKKDETLKAFYTEFLEALVACCSKVQQDVQKVAVIRRLILPPGAFNIEKYTSTRILHQLINGLGEQGVVEVFKLYKSIFLATLAKNPENSSETWLNFERLNAGYMLQHLLAHKSVQSSYEWREQQLCFLMTCGVFYVTDSAEICKKEASAEFSKDFAEQCKNMFYTSLQSKLTDLQQEKQLLFNLVHYCNERMQQKHAGKYFRIKNYDETLQKSWQTMFAAVSVSQQAEVSAKSKKHQKKDKTKDASGSSSNDKLELVFLILLLNMGLQLLREPEMAAPAIDDLLKCMERTKEQQKIKKKAKVTKGSSTEDEEEPEWIEVVVDLFLHLLSQNASALRNIVNALFPHLCGNLNLSSIHQILAMLDMKDGQNPLSAKSEVEGDDGEEEEEAEEEEGESKVEGDESDEAESENEEDDSEEDDDDDDEEEDDEDDEEVSATDKLRNVISQALMESGASVTADDDMESVDLNDMTEEEGNKLDEALASAFKAMKKTSGSAAQTKKSKSYRAKTTTVMHFRIRVLDLLEIYLNQKPTLLISIEIMLALFDMLEFCAGEELKPLQSKVERVLTKLTALKSYAPDDDLKQGNLVDFIRLVVEKKAPAVAFDLTNKLRNKCIVFLIGNSNKMAAADKPTKVLALCQEYLVEFVKSRNPIVNITLLSDIFKLRWQYVWELAVALVEQGISMQTRTFRRIQIYEILSVLYRNNELQKLNETTTKKELKKIEKILSAHIKALASVESAKHSPKEFQTLLELLLHAQKANTRLNLQSSICSAEIGEAVQGIRRHIRLESTQVYQRYCAAFKLQVIRNNEVQLGASKQNGIAADSDSDADEDSKSKTPQSKDDQSKSSKRKQSGQDSRKQKKQKKQQRIEAASRGLNGGFTFEQANDAASEEEAASSD